MWIIKLYCDWWRYYWSAWRHRKSLTYYPVELRPGTLDDIKRIAGEMFNKNYFWTADGIDKLFDSLDNPAQCYKDMINGILRDDCDGFHSAMYWLLYMNGIHCRLFNIVTSPIADSHTVLIFKWADGFCCLNYDVLSDVTDDKSSLLDFIKLTSYGDKPVKIIYTCFSKWNECRWEPDNGFLK
jgi:hypothetical protein